MGNMTPLLEEEIARMARSKVRARLREHKVKLDAMLDRVMSDERMQKLYEKVIVHEFERMAGEDNLYDILGHKRYSRLMDKVGRALISWIRVPRGGKHGRKGTKGRAT